MARKIKQFRFYGSGNVNNYPPCEDFSIYTSGSIFNEYYPIVQLGIQTLPGTQFYLNGYKEPIIVGATGIYEINLDGEIEIIKLEFNDNSMVNIANNSNNYLIIDIIYEAEEGN